MLKSEMEEMKRERPEGLTIQTGACKFCGQMQQIEALFSWTDDMCNELATEKCDCTDAMLYAQRKKQKAEAIKIIDKQFASHEEGVIPFLCTAAHLAIDGKIDAATVTIGSVKAKISVNAKGQVRIRRTRTDEEEQQV